MKNKEIVKKSDKASVGMPLKYLKEAVQNLVQEDGSLKPFLFVDNESGNYIMTEFDGNGDEMHLGISLYSVGAMYKEKKAEIIDAVFVTDSFFITYQDSSGSINDKKYCTRSRMPLEYFPDSKEAIIISRWNSKNNQNVTLISYSRKNNKIIFNKHIDMSQDASDNILKYFWNGYAHGIEGANEFASNLAEEFGKDIISENKYKKGN